MKKFVSSLLANTRDRRKRGFTLIELLIVIGILGILVVAVLLTLNPAEAQRKSRDVKRLRDMATLQTVMEQGINDGVITTASWGATALKDSSTGGQSCSAGWLGVNVCQYVQTLPIDPLNVSTTIAGASGAGQGCDSAHTSTGNAYYYVNFSGAANTYEVNVRQESTTNCSKILNDGGNSFKAVEAGSDLTLISGAN